MLAIPAMPVPPPPTPVNLAPAVVDGDDDDELFSLAARDVSPSF